MTATDIAGAGSQQSTICPSDNIPGGSGSRGLDDDVGTESIYHLKWIQWNSGKIPIVMQSRNGPCPLIATMNVLLLREKVKFPEMLEQISDNQLLTYLGECIMDYVPADIENDENAILNLEQNIHDAIEILPKLKTGLDVNIRFTGITDFEYTPECIIFDLLRIPLYHGWLSDPSSIEVQSAIGNQSYNQLVDNIITNKTSTDPEIMAKVLISEDFLERTASQLTHHGLIELKCNINDNEIGILFRNNHFLTIFKREGEIYTLVTDHGYLTEDNIIWETLDNIDGAGRFFDSNFSSSDITKKQVSVFQEMDQRRQQLENDFLMALSLKEVLNEDEASWPVLETTKRKKNDMQPSTSRDTFDVTPAREAISHNDTNWRDDRLRCRENDEASHSALDPSYTQLEDDRNYSSKESTVPSESIEPTHIIESPQLDQHQPEIFPQSTSGIALIDTTAAHQRVFEPSIPLIDSQSFIQQTDRLDDNVTEPRQPPSQTPATVSQGPTSNRRLKSEKNLKESNCIVN